ncbi:MAG: type II toxin-antitoxin system PemK/MazF family toxin [Acidimicrobiia bacterium]|nr:type II toxin-antitoxin system PemK/MazF family toxin [Acidimicrobiia bacterium]
MRRGDVYWVNLRNPIGSEPGHRRPVLIVSADSFNESRLENVVAAAITSSPAKTDRLRLPRSSACPLRGRTLIGSLPRGST